jgi:hypothetical protein
MASTIKLNGAVHSVAEPTARGHFAAWEQPELFSAEIRAAFRLLRNQSEDFSAPGATR